MSANSIKVVARFRPQNRIELESGGKPIVSFDGEDSCTLDVRHIKTWSSGFSQYTLLTLLFF